MNLKKLKLLLAHNSAWTFQKKLKMIVSCPEFILLSINNITRYIFDSHTNMKFILITVFMFQNLYRATQ